MPEPPVIAGMDLTQVRLVHGNNFGTSGYGLMNLMPDVVKNNTLSMLTWQRECESTEVDPSQLLVQGVEFIKTGSQDYNSFKHLFGRYDAEWFIYLGEFLIKLKEVARRAGLVWGAWVAENLPFIGKRTRERMMLLARRKDSHPYIILGTERLDILCNATKGMEGDDPIGTFMTNHGIQFDPTQEFDLDDFKLQVDIALNSQRLLKNGIEVDAEKVKALTITGRSLDQSLIQKMKDIKESGGDLNTFLTKVAMTGGGESLEADQKRLQDFNSLSNRLIATIDYLVTDHEDDLDKVDPETYFKLLKKLAKLQKFASFKEQVTATA
jgi:hypothetical protein